MEYKIQPWKHQEEAIEKFGKMPCGGLFFDVGTGKTCCAINILRHKYSQHKRLLRTLVLGPPIIIENWRREFFVHSNIKEKDVLSLYGPGKDRYRKFMLNAYETILDEVVPSSKIFITNYEALLMKDLYSAILKWKPEAIIFDESHKLKNPTSKRTKKAIELSQTAAYRFILTGTPVLNSPMDLFSQFLVMDRGETFGKNFFAFRGTYFVDKNAGMPTQRYFPNWVIRQGALEEMNKKMRRLASVAKKKDCLSLPPYIQTTIKVPMLPEQAKMYKDMKKDFVAFIEGKEVVATMAMTKALRLMQIASGFAKDVEGKEHSLGVTPKMEALEELLETITVDNKVIIWAVWKENYGQIRSVCEKLKIRSVELTGDTPANKRFEIVDDFNNNPETKVLIGHPGSGGVGVNLIAASYSIFYSRTFSLEHSLQAEARNYRGGSEIHEKVTRIDLVTEDTIDEAVLEKLLLKEEISFKLLKDLKSKI